MIMQGMVGFQYLLLTPPFEDRGAVKGVGRKL